MEMICPFNKYLASTRYVLGTSLNLQGDCILLGGGSCKYKCTQHLYVLGSLKKYHLINSHSTKKQEMLSSFFCKWGNCVTKQLSNLSRSRQLLSDGISNEYGQLDFSMCSLNLAILTGVCILLKGIFSWQTLSGLLVEWGYTWRPKKN